MPGGSSAAPLTFPFINLLSPANMREAGGTGCHYGSVPASAIIGALVISPVSKDLFQWIEAGENFVERIDAYANSLPELPPPSAFELAARAGAENRKPSRAGND